MHALQPGPREHDRSADDATAAAFVHAHQRGLWRFLRAIGCPGHAADEVAQDALLLALDRAVADAEAPAFLRQAAKFLWLRRQRDDRRAAEHLVAAAERLWQRDCERDDGDGLIVALRACVEALPPRSRLAVQRTYGDDSSRAELAAEFGLGEHGVRTLLQRVRKALRDCIERRLLR